MLSATVSGGSRLSKAPSPVRVGMSADEVLKLRGRSLDDSVRAPTVEEWSGDLIAQVIWHYTDVDVTLAHDGLKFRVANVVGAAR